MPAAGTERVSEPQPGLFRPLGAQGVKVEQPGLQAGHWPGHCSPAPRSWAQASAHGGGVVTMLVRGHWTGDEIGASRMPQATECVRVCACVRACARMRACAGESRGGLGGFPGLWHSLSSCLSSANGTVLDGLAEF